MPFSADSMALRICGRRQRVGKMNEVLIECRAMDAEDPPGSGIDADDVVVGIDDDDPDIEA